ncbi:hypothetical protein EV690_2532 [Celerinatantimonas diazotrophica]|uniref:Uncharacterized protein n=1 Tax=Celerinatantimonas diazotrophica TaxID=412034 RepID=A0A4R1JA57_9GAMM|nr:hypothetical protein EV690_2532 [Celerinatantimonas diazotrophica]CAG9296880.1 hypothetical protein CEDIAZO_02039 [Celerinatantimonas diazotrophica]
MKGIERPNTITLVIIATIVSFIIGVVKTYILFPSTVELSEFQLKVIVVFTLVVIMLLGVILYLIWKGKNWCRIIYAVFAIVGLVPFINAINQELNYSLLLAVISIIQVSLQLSATVLLYLPETNSWFSSIKASKYTLN